MSLPSIVGPKNPTGNTLSGIINEIHTRYNIDNPVSKGIIKATSSSGSIAGSVNTIANWDQTYFRIYSSSSVYVQMQFINRYIFPTAYSFRGVIPSDQYCYAKKWKVLGFNKEEENSPSMWSTLDEDASTSGSYCGTSTHCSGRNNETFLLKNVNKGYQCIRWTPSSSSCGNSDMYFAASAIEVYGTLSTSKSIKRARTREIKRYLVYASSFYIISFVLC